MGKPTQEDRLAILQLLCKKMPLYEDVDLKKIAEETEGSSGADLQLLCSEAGMKALNDDEEQFVRQSHFEAALRESGPILRLYVCQTHDNTVEIM